MYNCSISKSRDISIIAVHKICGILFVGQLVFTVCVCACVRVCVCVCVCVCFSGFFVYHFIIPTWFPHCGLVKWSFKILKKRHFPIHVFIHQSLKGILVYRYDISIRHHTQAVTFWSALHDGSPIWRMLESIDILFTVRAGLETVFGVFPLTIRNQEI